MDEKSKKRTRMVVEEVGEETKTPSEVNGAEQPAEEIKEKVEELQTITEHIGDDVEKSADVQEELAEAADKFAGNPVDIKAKMEETFPTKARGPSALIIIIPGVLLLGAILGGVYFYQKSLGGTTTSVSPTPFDNLATEAPLPSSSPSASLDLTKYSINVENGSGVAGTAGSAKDLLTKAGFTVGATGNADNYDYTDTVISAKAEVPQAFIDKLKLELEGVYSVAKPETLPDTSKDDVVVIIGSSKSQ